MKRKLLKDTPLSEITLRRFEKPMASDERDLIRKFCISIGLLQPGDSRDVIVDILNIILKAREKKTRLTSVEISNILISERKKLNDMRGVAQSNVRRHLKRLRQSKLIDRVNDTYRIREWLSLPEIIKEFIVPTILTPTIDRINDYAEKIEEIIESNNKNMSAPQ